MLLFNQYRKLDLLNEGGAGGGAAGATGNSGGAAGATGAAGGETHQMPAWESVMKALPEDLRSDSSLSTIKDVQSLVKTYVSAQKMIGKDKITIPDPKFATQEDYLNIFKKLGQPEKIDDYKFKLPDGLTEDQLDKDFTDKVKEAALAAGILPWQFEKIYAAYHGIMDGRMKEGQSKHTADQEQGLNALKQEWGQAFDTQVKRANVAFKELIPNEADRVSLINMGLGSHPVIMKLLVNASKYFKEDTFLGQGANTITNLTPEDALKKAREIQGDDKHPYRNPTHPNHTAAKKEVADLYSIAYPN